MTRLIEQLEPLITGPRQLAELNESVIYILDEKTTWNVISCWKPVKIMAQDKGVAVPTVLNRIKKGMYEAKSFCGIIMVSIPKSKKVE